ncbi:MAG: voltage-gated potassium channel [Nocardioidaceae bacterium]|nr:voltage-gated potassium channel [Nocardioidaceae bacterium]
MTNPLLLFWYRLVTGSDTGSEADANRRPPRWRAPMASSRQASATIFLVMRRMRAPLIILIVIFAVTTLGLTLVPGQDAAGRPWRMGFFDAFYVMSYTASTIGFGEIPYPFTYDQRMWVTISIYLTVVGWAYAIGSLLGLMQDRAFRRALTRRHVARKVQSLVEPFLVIVGYGNAAKRLGRSLDELGRRFVVIDDDENRVAAVELDSYRADTPALHGNARDTGNLVLAGLLHPHCEGVVALAGDDEVNLDVTMTAGLLRPGLPVIARTSSREVAERMRTFGVWEVVNPLDRFGNHLRILLRGPATYQLMMWLTSGPGTPLPARRDPLPRGRWVVCGHGGLVEELAEDLRAEGIELDVVEAGAPAGEPSARGDTARLAAARLEDAVAFAAATRDDMTNLWMLETARRSNPDLYLVAMQNRSANSALYRAVQVDFGMMPSEVIVHEVLARLANPALMQFLPRVPRLGEAWAEQMVATLVRRCGREAPDLWRVTLDSDEAPALQARLSQGPIRLGDLLRDPEHREQPLDMVALALLSGEDSVAAPDDDEPVGLGDRLLVASGRDARRALEATLCHEPTTAYVLEGRFVPSGWLWRALARSSDEHV